MKINALLISASLTAVALSLAACSTPASETSPSAPTSASPESSESSTPVAEPAVMDLDELEGETVTLKVGETLDINTGTQPSDVYTGDVENPDVVEFIPGAETTLATFNPGVKALKTGSSTVVLTNAEDRSEPVTFTVTVK
jgi:hypothetical protein